MGQLLDLVHPTWGVKRFTEAIQVTVLHDRDCLLGGWFEGPISLVIDLGLGSLQYI